MTLVIADTSAIIAAYDRASANHERAREELAGCTSIVSPMVLDEVDHLLVARFGKDRSVANLVLDDLLASATEAAVVVPAIELTELEAARRVIEQYRDLRLDLTDALSVVLAARFGVTEILTLDEGLPHPPAAHPRSGRVRPPHPGRTISYGRCAVAVSPAARARDQRRARSSRTVTNR